MKKAVASIICVGALIISGLVFAQPASAETVTTSKPLPVITARELAQFKTCVFLGTEATLPCQRLSVKMTGLAQPATITNNNLDPHLSVSFGWAYYLHLSHNDAASVSYVVALAGVGVAFAALCSAVGLVFPVVGVACGVYAAIVGGLAAILISEAAQKWSWYYAWWCPGVGALAPPTCQNAWLVNAGHADQVWEYPVQDWGITFSIAYWGQPLGYTFDQGACPC